MNRFYNLMLFSGFFVSFFLSPMEENTSEKNVVTGYIEHVRNYLDVSHKSEINKTFEKKYIACDLYNQDKLFNKVKKFIYQFDKISSILKEMNEHLGSKVVDGEALCSFDSLESIAFFIQTKDFFTHGFSAKKDAWIECERMMKSLENNVDSELRKFGLYIPFKYKIDKLLVSNRELLLEIVSLIHGLENKKLKNGKEIFQTTDDLDLDNIWYANRNHFDFLRDIQNCSGVIRSFTSEISLKNGLLAEQMLREKLSILCDGYMSKRPLYIELFNELKSQLDNEFKGLSKNPQFVANASLARQVFKVQSQFEPFFKSEEELYQQNLIKKKMEEEAAKSFLPEYFGNKKSQKKQQPKSKPKGSPSNNTNSVVARFDSKKSKKSHGNQDQKLSEVIATQKTDPQSKTQFASLTYSISHSLKQQPLSLATMPDKSYIVRDNGYVIDFSYDLEGLNGTVTDRILRINKDCRVENGPQLVYHARVQAKKDAYRSGKRDEDTVSHTFPESLDCLVGQSIQTTFTDKSDQPINNRVFFGEKLIEGKYERGFYILGFFHKNHQDICYHECFKKRDLNRAKHQQFANLLTDAEKESFAECLKHLDEN